MAKSASLSRPFQVLADDITWFVTCPELRLLHVTTSPEDRALVLELLARSEGHPCNHAPYFVLEDHVTGDDTGFLSRAHRVRLAHTARRELLAKEGIALGEGARVDASADTVFAFGEQLLACLRAQDSAPVLSGLTVVLAPTVVAPNTPFADELLGLVDAPSLAHVRWIVLEADEPRLLAPLEAALGETLLRASAIVPEADRRADLEARLDAMAKAPAGASPEVQVGFAGPRHVVAPPRFGDIARDPEAPEVKALLEKELGPLASLVGAGGALLRRRIAGAALAARDGKPREAAALQAAACASCLQAGLFELACILEMTLAAYLLAGGERAKAIVAFQSAADRAHAHALPGPEAQAYTGLGSLLMLERRVADAVVAYRTAAERAERAQIPALAIEAYRCAGQASLDAGALNAATTLWTRALAVADRALPTEAAASSAPAVARALARVLQELGSFASAQALLDQAERLEHPVVPAGAESKNPNDGSRGEPNGGD